MAKQLENGVWIDIPGLDEKIITMFCQGDGKTGVVITLDKNLKIFQSTDLIGSVSAPDHVKIILKKKSSHCFFSSKVDVTSANQDSKVLQLEPPASQMSCTELQNKFWCWYISESGLSLGHWKSCNALSETGDLTKPTNNMVISLSVFKRELWLIETGGKFVWRRLGITSLKPAGTNWMRLPFNLPSPAKYVAVGNQSVYILMNSGDVVSFQGMFIYVYHS